MWIKFHHALLIISNWSAIWLKKWNNNKLLQVVQKFKKQQGLGGTAHQLGFLFLLGPLPYSEWSCFPAPQFTLLSCLKPYSGFLLHLECGANYLNYLQSPIEHSIPPPWLPHLCLLSFSHTGSPTLPLLFINLQSPDHRHSSFVCKP